MSKKKENTKPLKKKKKKEKNAGGRRVVVIIFVVVIGITVVFWLIGAVGKGKIGRPDFGLEDKWVYERDN